MNGARFSLRRKCLGIVPGTNHRVIAVEDCEVLQVSTQELGDGVRLKDRYAVVGGFSTDSDSESGTICRVNGGQESRIRGTNTW